MENSQVLLQSPRQLEAVGKAYFFREVIERRVIKRTVLVPGTSTYQIRNCFGFKILLFGIMLTDSLASLADVLRGTGTTKNICNGQTF